MRLSLLLVTLVGAGGCNLKQVAMRSLANTVSEPGDTYARDDDPELVRDALPVMLKIMEQLGDGLPDHKGIHLALVRTFTSFGVAFVQDDAERLHETNVDKARPLFTRARKLFKRAWGYGTKGLDIAVHGLGEAFRSTSSTKEERLRLLAMVKKEDVGLLYWCGAALGSLVSVSKDDMKLVGEVPKVEELMKRALELDETFDQGAIHEFYITYTPKKAKEHLDRALALSKNKKLGPLVAYAEAVTVEAQNKKEFLRLLEQVTAFDVDSAPENRLVNVLTQRRARWLLSRTSDLFAE